MSPGLRWEPRLAPYRAQQDMVHFEREWFDKGVKSTRFKNAPAGLQYMGDALYPAKGKKLDVDSWLHFAPRLGLAWDVGGDGRTTIRSAYGLFFDLPPLYHWGGNHSPYSNQVTLNDPPGGLDDTWLGYAGGSNPFPTPLTADAPFYEQVSYINYGVPFASAYVHQWNLSLQRQVGTDWMVSANYVGNSTIHGQNAVEADPAIYLPGASCVIAGRTFSPCSTTRKYQPAAGSVPSQSRRRKVFLTHPGNEIPGHIQLQWDVALYPAPPEQWSDRPGQLHLVTLYRGCVCGRGQFFNQGDCVSRSSPGHTRRLCGRRTAQRQYVDRV